MRRSTWPPTMSAAVQPNMRSAALLNERTTPWRSRLTMASPAVSRIACVNPASARGVPGAVLVGVDIRGLGRVCGGMGHGELAHARSQLGGAVGGIEDGRQIGVRTAARLELQGQQLAVPTDDEQLVVELVHQLPDGPGVLLCVHPRQQSATSRGP